MLALFFNIILFTSVKCGKFLKSSKTLLELFMKKPLEDVVAITTE